MRTIIHVSSNCLRLSGEQNDSTVARSPYYLRARYYDPATGRFLTRDPFPGLAAMPQSLNRYPYVMGNPTTLTDPAGLQCIGRTGICVIPPIGPGWEDEAEKVGDAGRWVMSCVMHPSECVQEIRIKAEKGLSEAGRFMGDSSRFVGDVWDEVIRSINFECWAAQIKWSGAALGTTFSYVTGNDAGVVWYGTQMGAAYQQYQRECDPNQWR